MREAVKAVLEGTQQSKAQASGGKTNRKPTLAQTAVLDRKLLRNQTADVPAAMRLLKSTISAGGFKAWKLGLSRIVAPRITVLLYHRVTDEVRDNLTVGIEQFDRQMAMLRKHCQILSIEEIVATEKVSMSGAPLVCVTFDDGYLDNYTNAAQILLRHQIPAAFFVSTGIINTDRTFPHDVRRGNSTIPVMDWDHLRKMRDHGFGIGSHSVSHIDCAAEPDNVVTAELSQSLSDLRRNLDLKEVLFAYPYGGRKNMTPQKLELVKQAGYAGCLSAYGGANVGKVDRFNVVRRGIHWEFSDNAFLFASLGLG
jgi:peptidoglycan/xylan/chitin deacetylase (PgdA/CDA1 family)